jgi:hypothetical protein
MITTRNQTRAAGLALACILLPACGRIGTLEQPAPLYGAKAKADYQAKKAAEASAAAVHHEQDAPEVIAPIGEPLPAGAVPPPVPSSPKPPGTGPGAA